MQPTIKASVADVQMPVGTPERGQSIAIAELKKVTKRAAAQNMSIKHGDERRTDRILLSGMTSPLSIPM